MPTVSIPGTIASTAGIAETLGSFRHQVGLDDLYYASDTTDDAAFLAEVAGRYNDTRTALNTRYSATLGSAIADVNNTTVAAVLAATKALAAAVQPHLAP